jgi:twitching motility protein PilI
VSTENQAESWLKPSAALSRVPLPEDWAGESGVTAAWEERRYGFSVGNIGLLIGSGTPSEIPERAEVYPLPGVPTWFRGLVSLRGNLVPVFDVGRLLGHHEEPLRQQVLILEREETAAGLLIEGFPQAVGKLRALSQRPPLPPVLRSYVPEAFAEGTRIWLEFDHRGFFQSLAARFTT